MSQSVRDFERTFVAAADLSAKQFYIVKLDSSSNGIALSAAATDVHIGVLQNTPASGEAATVRFLGTSKVVAGAAITKGAYVAADSAGKAAATTTDKDNSIGVALEAAAADGDIIEVLLAPVMERSV
jgi:hypothetical protein